MDWRHEVSPSWMLERRDVLTATELSSCIAAWKRITKAQKECEALFPAFAQLWAKKQSTSEPDTWSKGPAARGHILEPYAIEDWNKQSKDEKFYHWDDTIIKRKGLGWSPDGLNVPQETGRPVVVEIDGRLCDQDHAFNSPLPTSLIEIKSYEPSKHMKCMMLTPDKLDERWQIACGMWVLPSIENAVILFYSIDTDLSFYVRYDRSNLSEELVQIEEMVGLWNKTVAKLNEMPHRFTRSVTEEQVYEEYLNEQMDILRI